MHTITELREMAGAASNPYALVDALAATLRAERNDPAYRPAAIALYDQLGNVLRNALGWNLDPIAAFTTLADA